MADARTTCWGFPRQSRWWKAYLSVLPWCMVGFARSCETLRAWSPLQHVHKRTLHYPALAWSQATVKPAQGETARATYTDDRFGSFPFLVQVCWGHPLRLASPAIFFSAGDDLLVGTFASKLQTCPLCQGFRFPMTHHIMARAENQSFLPP